MRSPPRELRHISVSAGGRFEDAVPREGEALDPYTGYSGHRTMPPLWMDKKVNVYLAAAIKESVNQAGYTTPIITAGRIPDAETADEAELFGRARIRARITGNQRLDDLGRRSITSFSICLTLLWAWRALVFLARKRSTKA